MAAPPFDVRVERRDADAVVVVAGELDLATADRFERAMSRAFELADAWSVDARGLSFVDSSGVRAFLRAHAEAQRRGQRLAVRGLSGAPRSALEHMDLLHLLEG